jgi:hypothetical protein
MDHPTGGTLVKRASTLPLVFALMLLVAAACSSGSSPAASVSEAPESEAVATATPAASIDAGESTIALPSFEEGAGELADVLPTEVGGIAITYESSTGAEGMGDMTPEEQAFIDRIGVDPSQVAFAFGSGGDFTGEDGYIIITATRVPGVDTNTLRDEFIAVLEEEGESTAVEQTISGKTVHAFGSEEEGSLGYPYVTGDIVFSVFALPADLAEEVFAALP